MNENKQFSLAQVWNSAFDETKREIKERDYLYASELGRMDLDIILKMKGIEPTNAPTDRAKRKFETGDLWEWFVSLILKRSGITFTTQDRVYLRYPGLLAVSGKTDYIIEGKPDYEKAVKQLKSFTKEDLKQDLIAFIKIKGNIPEDLLDQVADFVLMYIKDFALPELFFRRVEEVINYLKESFPNGIPKQILEVKSCSEAVMTMVEKSDKASLSYMLQLYHYCRNTGLNGLLIYICKDDSRMKEFIITPDNEVLEKLYIDKVTRITEYYKTDKIPEKEKIVLWNEDLKKFTLNLNIQWSDYLTLNYDLKNETEYGDIYRGVVTSWNSVVNRVKNGLYLSEKNLAYIEKMKLNGFDLKQLLGMEFVLVKPEKKDKTDEVTDEDLEEAEALGITIEELLEQRKLFAEKKKKLLVDMVPEIIPKAEKIIKTKTKK